MAFGIGTRLGLEGRHQSSEMNKGPTDNLWNSDPSTCPPQVAEKCVLTLREATPLEVARVVQAFAAGPSREQGADGFAELLYRICQSMGTLPHSGKRA